MRDEAFLIAVNIAKFPSVPVARIERRLALFNKENAAGVAALGRSQNASEEISHQAQSTN
jgi:hypothetical protein